MLGGIPAKSISVANRMAATSDGRVLTIAEVPRGLITPETMRRPRRAIQATPEQVHYQRSQWTAPTRRVGAGRFRFMDMEFWAESGGVYIIDHNPPPATVRNAQQCGRDPHDPIPCTLPAWKERCEMFTGMLAHYEREHAHTGNVQKEAQYCANLRSLVEAAWTVYRMAKQQGDLTDPRVQRYYREHLASQPQNFPVTWGEPQTVRVGDADVLAPDA